MMNKETKESENLLFINTLLKNKKYKHYINGNHFLRYIHTKNLAIQKLKYDILNKKNKYLLSDIIYLFFSKKYYGQKYCYLPSDNIKEYFYTYNNRYFDKKVVVYTSIFGSYDSINEPLYVNPNIRYVAITDLEISNNSVWEKYDYSNLKDFNLLDAYHKSKFCKMFPNLLFPDADFSIWVDGNIQIVADLYPFIDRFEENKVIAMFEHPTNNEIFEEKDSAIFFEKVDKHLITKQIDDYKKNGFPSKFGMKECSIIIRKHNDAECIRLMNNWWQEVSVYTMRDQISFPYVLWKNNHSIDYVQSLGTNWRWNARLMEFEHKK